jgi:hypothetical protein
MLGMQTLQVSIGSYGLFVFRSICHLPGYVSKSYQDQLSTVGVFLKEIGIVESLCQRPNKGGSSHTEENDVLLLFSFLLSIFSFSMVKYVMKSLPCSLM